MRTTPSFILEQRRAQRETHFACYLRNLTGNAISLTVPLGIMESEPQMSPNSYTALLARNRARVSGVSLTGPVEESQPIEPIVNLQHPDLPWKLEKDSPPPGKTPNGGINTDASPDW